MPQTARIAKTATAQNITQRYLQVSHQRKLDALTRFCAAEIQPALAAAGDKPLAFRALIAANLASMVAAELRAEDALEDAELCRLVALLPDAEVPAGRREAIRALTALLSQRIRARGAAALSPGPLWEHVMQTLREKLQVQNPRFDLRREIESP